ncbi:MAG: hypothetical protein QXK37_05595 [Candidatus Woesearchaeota archaeon]
MQKEAVVIEEDDTVRYLMHEILKEEGYNIHLFANCNEAAHYLKENECSGYISPALFLFLYTSPTEMVRAKSIPMLGKARFELKTSNLEEVIGEMSNKHSRLIKEGIECPLVIATTQKEIDSIVQLINTEYIELYNK